jgi:hypothetical protein
MTEPTYQCPKCHQLFPMSQMYAHYRDCKGAVVATVPFPQQYQVPQAPQMYIPPPIPEHHHQWFENDTYKVCLDQSCKQIKVKLRGSWMIFWRYGFKLFWIELVIAFAVAFAVFSATGIRR